MIYSITSKQNQKIKDLMKLRNSPKNSDLFVVEGLHMLEMAIELKVVKEIYSLKEIPGLDVDQYIVSEDVLDKISSQKSAQGVVVVCNKKISNLSEISDKVLYLDDVQDPGNLGTILRTALAFNFNTVLLSKNSCNPYNEKALQSSQGAIFKLNILEANCETLLKLKKDGYKVYSTEIKGSEELSKLESPKKLVLVLGNEAHGVSKEILKISDKRVRIEISNIESLNVGVAAGIAMHFFNNK